MGQTVRLAALRKDVDVVLQRLEQLGTDVPSGPWRDFDEAFLILTAWAADPATGGGAHGLIRQGNTHKDRAILQGNLGRRRGERRMLRCDKQGKTSTNPGAPVASRRSQGSKRCGCGFHIRLEEVLDTTCNESRCGTLPCPADVLPIDARSTP